MARTASQWQRLMTMSRASEASWAFAQTRRRQAWRQPTSWPAYVTSHSPPKTCPHDRNLDGLIRPERPADAEDPPGNPPDPLDRHIHSVINRAARDTWRQ